MKKALNEALADGVFTDDEVTRLNRLQNELGLSDKIINAMREAHAKKALAPFIDKIDRTLRFSPADEEALQKVCANLKIKPELGEGVDFARTLWRIDNEPGFLPEPIETDLILKKNEAVYAGSYCDWRQFKTRRTSRSYSGMSVGFRVAKGVTLRFGQYAPVGRVVEELRTLSSGRLFVTNKRITFVGDRRSTNVTYTRMANLEIFSDGLAINKTSGPPDYFLGIEKAVVEYIAAIIQKSAYE